MINVGDILSTMGGVQYRGGYHEYHGGYLEYSGGYSVPWGENLLLFEYPTVLITPHSTHDILHMYHDIPHGTQISKDGIPPIVLNTPHGTHDIPHVHHDIPPRYSREPPRYS